MRAVALSGLGEPLTLGELPDPTPEPGEVVVAVDACGICGSDLHTAEHLPLPGLVMGHEFCGTVVETTPGAGHWRPGDRVVGVSLATCGTCDACRDGRIRKCLAAQMIGFDRAGAYADYVALPHTSLLALPDDLDHRHGALVEPLAVARHAVERAAVAPGDAVAVLGAGPVGLAVLLWLRHLGAGPVVVTDPSPGRRAMALELGATAALDPTATDVAAESADLCHGAPSRVIECVGVAGLLQSATEVVGVDGVVSVTGVCMTAEEIFPLVAMTKELDVRFAFFYRRQDMEATIAATAGGSLDPLALVTDEIGLDGLPARFETLKRPNLDAKVLVRPRQDSNLRPSA
jgi:(R,R)-butanediol dehydrogenase/meso-butanediol dehydrogenase/diacetyl reductase